MRKLLLPYNGDVYLSSKYGERTLFGKTEFHSGIDIVGMDSKVLHSPCTGRVAMSAIYDEETDTTRNWEWGNFVAIDTADNLRIFLCHMKERAVEVGQYVSTGDVIGVEGNTGYSFGSHCHFEVRQNNKAIDPTPLLSIDNNIGIYTNDVLPPYVGIPGDGNVPHKWAEESVKWCLDNGILVGDSNSKISLRLNDNITREEMCVLMHRLYSVLSDNGILY